MVVEPIEFHVRIAGVDITRILKSVLIREENNINRIELELLPQFRSDSGDVHRHLKGLEKAKS